MIKNDGGLYDQQFEHDNCGIGAVVNINGTPSHQTVEDAWGRNSAANFPPFFL